jgi:cell division protein FtsL
MRPFGFFEHRFRGFRVVELGGLGVLLILILTVYLAKTGAGGKRADIDRIQKQITDEQTQVRMLRAEVATLEQPARLEALSARYLGLQPISARREVTAQGLQDVARVAVVDHKATSVTGDPLTAVGSPDLPNAAPPSPVVATAPTPDAAPADPADDATVDDKPPVAKVAIAAKPLKLARAEPAPHSPAAHAARPAAAHKASGGSAIDDILQGTH